MQQTSCQGRERGSPEVHQTVRIVHAVKAEMKAIELLMHEHRIIEGNLHAMEAWARAARHESDSAEREVLARYVAFLRDFVDERHHGKEEDILFTVMMEHGFSREHGPLWVMLHEHDLGRSLVGTLANLVAQPTAWSDEDRYRLERTVKAYAALMRDHIRKEDRVLYPLAERRLPRAAKQQVSMQVLAAHLFEELVASRSVP